MGAAQQPNANPDQQPATPEVTQVGHLIRTENLPLLLGWTLNLRKENQSRKLFQVLKHPKPPVLPDESFSVPFDDVGENLVGTVPGIFSRL